MLTGVVAIGVNQCVAVLAQSMKLLSGFCSGVNTVLARGLCRCCWSVLEYIYVSLQPGSDL